MEFHFIGIVNRILMMGQQNPITTLETTVSSWGYKAQLAVNDAIQYLSIALRIKPRGVNFTITTVAGQRTYAVPRQVMYPFISLKQANTPTQIQQMATSDYDRLIPSDTSSDNPEQYYVEEFAGVTAQPTSATQIGIASSSSADSSQVIIQGYDASNNYIKEQLSLTGTSIATSVNTYKYLSSISKLATTGIVTITNSGGSSTYLILNPTENLMRTPIIGLYPIPSGAITIYGRGYAKINPLTYDYETPIGIPDYALNAIVANAFARFVQYDPKTDTMAKESLWKLSDTEVARLVAMDVKAGINYRMKQSAWEMPLVQRFNPLER